MISAHHSKDPRLLIDLWRYLRTLQRTAAITEGTDNSPPAKRQKITPMTPASHSVRYLEEQDEDDFSVSKMDKAIQTYFQGNFFSISVNL